jgi:hypothetical protein
MDSEFSRNAAKLAAFIDNLLAGETADDASAKAGVASDLARRFLESCKQTMSPKPSKNRPLPAGGADRVVAFSDGASRGNPGRAACAVIMLDPKGEEIYRRAKLLRSRSSSCVWTANSWSSN